jgi:predicted nucleic acid-binding protein
VLVYAYDVDAGQKHDAARALIADLWRTRRGVISTQMMQEFYVTVCRKLSTRLDRLTARAVIETYRAWPVHALDVSDVLAASELEERYQLSFWDALIIAAAQRMNADRVVTEDFQDGRRLEGILIENPFAVL